MSTKRPSTPRPAPAAELSLTQRLCAAHDAGWAAGKLGTIPLPPALGSEEEIYLWLRGWTSADLATNQCRLKATLAGLHAVIDNLVLETLNDT